MEATRVVGSYQSLGGSVDELLNDSEAKRAMKWQYKARLQNTIAALPCSNAIYYAVQRCVGDLRKNRFDPLEWFQVTGRALQRLQSQGFTIAGKNILEVGTGRAVGVPLAMWLCGANRIVTVDLNRYLSPALVWASNRYLLQNPEKLREIFAGLADNQVFEQRMWQIQNFRGDLGVFLKFIHTDYMAPADARQLPLADSAFDLHFSYAVFEHVPPAEIRAILKEARRVLRPGGLVLHSIDLSDHFAYGDESITKINFLQFNDREWNRWAGNQYMYHNRLRAADVFRLFEECGLRVTRKAQTLDERSLCELKRGFPLDSQFAGIAPEDLAITNVSVMGSFSNGEKTHG
jgi:SAM-dependent methyltransferase